MFKKNWENIHSSFTSKLQKQWEDKGFTYKQAKKWMSIGFIPDELNHVWWLINIQNQTFDPNLNVEESKKTFKKYLEKLYQEWGNIHEDFKSGWALTWMINGFDYQQTKEWIGIGLKPKQYDFATYLQKNNHLPQPLLVNNNLERLKGEYALEIGDWTFIHKNFAEYLQKEWEGYGFHLSTTKSWIEKGLTPYESEFAFYLKKNGYRPEQISDLEGLKKEYYQAQNWLDFWYPRKGTCIMKEGNNSDNFGKTRRQITWLDIQNKKFVGSLKLEGFDNLKNLWLLRSQLTSLDLTDCANLEEIYCGNNQQLAQIKLSKEKKLKRLNLSNNNFPEQDLSFVSHLTNLRSLELQSNSFTGSLEYLQDMEKLEKLDISNTKINDSLKNLKSLTKLESLNVSDTDIDGGLEYLLENIKEFDCSVNYRKDAQVKAIYDLLTNKLVFNELINRQRLRRYYSRGIEDLPQKIKEIKQKIEQWKKLGLNFAEQEISKTNDVEFRLDDYGFIKWLIEVKGYSSEWILNHKEKCQVLKEEYQVLNERCEKYNLCFECNQPNTGRGWCRSCNSQYLKMRFKNWTSGNEDIDKHIQKNQQEAMNADKTLEWIPYEQFSEVEHLADGGFGKVYKAKWPAGNDGANLITKWNWNKNRIIERIVDNRKNHGKIINKNLIENMINDKGLVDAIGRHGSYVEVVLIDDKWGHGESYSWWDTWSPYFQSAEFRHYPNERFIALKSLNNSQNITADFLQEIASHKLVESDMIVSCFGISQDPQTKNYLMVMDYIKDGNLRNYLQNSQEDDSDDEPRIYGRNQQHSSQKDRLELNNKIKQLFRITQGLNQIHKQGLVHRDLHSGNILSGYDGLYITDLGLCRPVNETDQGKSYGILPYVAPEVLQQRSYTQASDVYSFGVIAYELFAGTSPYFNRKYDSSLASDIVYKSLRPNLKSINIPLSLKELIERCWDANPRKRPTANELEKTLNSWLSEINEEDSEFYQQFRKDEKEYNQTSQKVSYKIHPTEKLSSRLLNFGFCDQLLAFEQTDLNKEIEKIEEKLNLSFNNELKELVKNFIITNQKSLKEKSEEARNNVKESENKLKGKLEEENFLKKDIKEIILCCEEVNLVKENDLVNESKLKDQEAEPVIIKQITEQEKQEIEHSSKNLDESIVTEWSREAKLEQKENSQNQSQQKEDLLKQIENKKTELEQLIVPAKNNLKSKKSLISEKEREKRTKEREELLNKLLQTQEKIIRLENSVVGGGLIATQSWLLQNARQNLSKKLTVEELDNLCQTQTELIKLQIELENLQIREQQAQIIQPTNPLSKN